MTEPTHYHQRIQRATERLAQLQARELLASQRQLQGRKPLSNGNRPSGARDWQTSCSWPGQKRWTMGNWSALCCSTWTETTSKSIGKPHVHAVQFDWPWLSKRAPQSGISRQRGKPEA